MIATTFKVVDRPRQPPSRRADIRDFLLRETGQVPAGKILENPHITLYSLDFENRRAVFVETSADVNLSQAPFYFITQFEKAERVLTILHTIYAFLLVLFGIGVLQLVRTSQRSRLIGISGASAFIAMGLASVLSATLFPQDAWGSAPTFAGQMHQFVHGVISLLSILYMMLIGIWMNRAEGFPRFRTYSFITIGDLPWIPNSDTMYEATTDPAKLPSPHDSQGLQRVVRPLGLKAGAT
jgi:hypothetical protein